MMEKKDVMPPTLKRVGFTLPGSTATTRHGASWGSIRDLLRPHQRLGTSTVVMLAGLLGYTAIAQPEPVYPTPLGLAGGSCHHRGKQRPAPKVSQAEGLKVVCSPEQQYRISFRDRKVPCGLPALSRSCCAPNLSGRSATDLVLAVAQQSFYIGKPKGSCIGRLPSARPPL